MGAIVLREGCVNIVIGPILHLRSSVQDSWQLRVVLVISGATGREEVVFRSDVGMLRAPLRSLFSFAVQRGERTAVTAELSLPRGILDRTWSYRIELDGKGVDVGSLGGRIGGAAADGWIAPVVVPAVQAVPRIAFFSSNGFSTGSCAAQVADPEVLWRDLARRHQGEVAPGDRRRPWHVMIGGGNQVYADWLWMRDTELGNLLQAGRELRWRTATSSHRRVRLTTRWLQLYERFWHSSGIGWAAARIPGLYTWDDHEIVVGWGSSEEHHHDEGFGLWDDAIVSAGLTYDVVQCGQRPGRDRFRHVRLSSTSSSLEIWMLDGRTKRTPKQVLGDAQWRWIEQRIAVMETDPPEHLFVVVSVPPVARRFPTSAALPLTDFELSADLSDDWEFAPHRDERARLLRALVGLQERAGVRVTVLSGCGNVGGRAEVVRQRRGQAVGTPIHQFVSSGIMHPPPSALEQLGLRTVGSGQPDAVTEHIIATLQPVGGAGCLRARNYLQLMPERTLNGVAFWAQWVRAANHSELAEVVPEKVVVRSL